MGPEQASDPRAMPLDAFIAESLAILAAGTANGEICVEAVKPLRLAEARGGYDAFFTAFNVGFAGRH
jgi:uncharacterized oxidoreductase